MPAPIDPGLHPETLLVHAGSARSQFGETSEALFLTQGYVYDTAGEAEARFKSGRGYLYGRYVNPTIEMFQDRIAALEGAEAARATSSGMAAVTLALEACLRAGDHIVAAKALFGSCRYIVEHFLPRFGVPCTLVDGTDLDQWKAAIGPKTKAVFLESPTNPTLEVLDIPAIAALAHAVGAKVVVDNVFATPLLQRPLELGADIVVYSATKHMDGQGRVLGGVVLGPREWMDKEVQPIYKHTGPHLSPFNAWVLLKGLETLPLRVERQSSSAAKIADFLAGRPGITRLIYPGRADHPQAALVKKQMKAGSTMIAFELAGGRDAAFAFADRLKLILISNNLGDAKSLLTHPASTTHYSMTEAARAELGISPGLLRLSVGLEHPDDLVADIAQALDAAAALPTAAE